MSRVNSDTQAFSQVVVLAVDLLSQVLVVALLVAYLFTIDARLTWIMLAFAPFIVAAALGFRHFARNAITQARRAGANVSAHIQETISGIGVAKAFRQERAIGVLSKGRIIEQGTHDALLASGGHYAKLYNTHFRHQPLAFIEANAPPRARATGAARSYNAWILQLNVRIAAVTRSSPRCPQKYPDMCAVPAPQWERSATLSLNIRDS